MGLDMYIHKTVHKYGDSNNIDDLTYDKFGRTNSYDLTTTVGYWRKANAIHRYFVKNFGDGVDESQDMYITTDDLKNLIGVCENVIKVFVGKKLVLNKTPENTEGVADEVTITEDWLKDNWEKLFSYDLAEALTEDEVKSIVDILPTQSGFFFGSTDYDVGYLYDIVKTVYMLDDIIANDKPEDYAQYTYYGSW